MTELTVGQTTDQPIEPGQKLRFDDRIDTDTEISSAQVLSIIGRSFKLLSNVKMLFTAKFVLSFGMIIPLLLMPWIGKILVDNVLLQKPFGETEVRYPPFMDPVITWFTGMDPLYIMLHLSAFFALMLLLVGLRMEEGTWAGTFDGSDTATEAENEISGGDSDAGGILGLIEFWVNVRLTQRIVNRLRTRLFERMSRLPMTALDDQRIGDSIYRVLYDAPAVPSICYQITIAPFFTLIAALINMYLMKYTYETVVPEVVWIAWAILPVTLLLTFPLSGLMRRVNQTKRAAGSATTNVMEEVGNNIDAVQSLGGMEREKNRFAGRSSEAFRRDRFAMLISIVISVITMILLMIGGIYVIILTTDQIIEGTMTPGDFAVLFGIYLGLAKAATDIGMFWIDLQASVAAVRRVFFFIDFASDEDRAGNVVLGPITRGVSIKDVDFDYPDGSSALRNINLELSVGELVAFVGPTGAGKTSLAYLIPSLLRPTRGTVSIDGQDIAEVELDSLRGQIAYVFQEHLLLSESIRENLLLANANASEADLLAALETAGCMDFIDTFPDGIDTVLGRAGNTLSVGQQQRLSIARGLVRDARVLILDEPTAALDPYTENALVEALHRATESRLVIVIAHRLSTIRRADRIIFLEDGEIRDSGTHASMMADAGSPYRSFVEMQQGLNPSI